MKENNFDRKLRLRAIKRELNKKYTANRRELILKYVITLNS
jgi:hypothetical protein